VLSDGDQLKELFENKSCFKPSTRLSNQNIKIDEKE